MSQGDTGIPVFDRTIHKTNIWLKEIMNELDWTDRKRAYACLRAVLQALRDRMTMAEAVHFGAQLPLLLRGVFYEGFSHHEQPSREKTREEFLFAVRSHLGRVSGVSLDFDLEEVTLAVIKVICRHVTEGEMEDVIQSMPKNIRTLFPVIGVSQHRY